MERSDHRITHYASSPERWPSGLKGAAEVAAELLISEERLLELAAAGYAPHYRIDGQGPLFRLAEVKEWARRNLVVQCEGKPLPVRLEITVEAIPFTTAPKAIRDLPELVELPLATYSGVYFLVKDDRVVYVGQSTSPMARVGNHVANPHKDFDRVFLLPVPHSVLDAVEGALIRWLQPALNGGRQGIRGPGRAEDDAAVLERIFRQAPEHVAVEGLEVEMVR